MLNPNAPILNGLSMGATTFPLNSAALAMTPAHGMAYQTEIAHQTEIDGSIGVTHHIEPNDTPRAGEASTAWFVLTRRGGVEVPLTGCDCRLAVYDASGMLGSEPLVQPVLRAIAVEGRTGVPAATVTFPAPGLYRLVLKGSALEPERFDPFEVAFSVTVAAGRSQTSTAPNPAVPTSAAPTTAGPKQVTVIVQPALNPLLSLGQSYGLAIILGLSLGIGGALAWWYWIKD